MNRYFHLFKNILILGIGTFASKLVSYLMMPLYTGVMTQDMYGTAELVTNTANLLIPLVSLSIADAVVRYAMESKKQRSDAFSAGIVTVLLCYGAFLLVFPAMLQISAIREYVWLLYIYIIASLMNTIVSLFARCIGFMRLYAYAGFQNTVLVVSLNLLFLLVFKMGVLGYLLSIVIADAVSALFLFFVGGLRRYCKFRTFDRSIWKQMVRFSVPLIPNSLCWWIVNLSDSYLITYLLPNGIAINGLYRAAYKLPGFITMISTIFMQAWQLSAIESYNERDKARFYSKVLNALQMLVFTSSSLIMLLVRPIMSVMVNESYYISWQLAPFLLAAAAFQCFVSFYATLYVAAKRSVFSMLTALIGAVANVALNLLLIPMWGAQGAAIATFASYFVVFIARAIDCNRRFSITLQPFWLVLNTAVVVLQAFVMISEPPYGLAIEVGLTVAMLAINTPGMLRSLRQLVRMKRGLAEE